MDEERVDTMMATLKKEKEREAEMNKQVKTKESTKGRGHVVLVIPSFPLTNSKIFFETHIIISALASISVIGQFPPATCKCFHGQSRRFITLAIVDKAEIMYFRLGINVGLFPA
jgi:hypothetical protein